MMVLPKNNFPLLARNLLSKRKQKILTLEKLEKTMKEKSFFENKISAFLEAFFYKIAKAQKMANVAGRRVAYCRQQGVTHICKVLNIITLTLFVYK